MANRDDAEKLLATVFGRFTVVERSPVEYMREFRQRCHACPAMFRVAVSETALEDAIDPSVVYAGAAEALNDQQLEHICHYIPSDAECARLSVADLELLSERFESEALALMAKSDHYRKVAKARAA